ncbi:MAG: GTP cyclohydrolase I FolE [Elusimicrobiales bacterium]|jgi:GTP cyclohydrolase I|nr:GTP cyclohydrolase I FolE [Elusimicrobiales bacterium]NLH39573.1 GTP cyclohydrolase I FolE [Elusimicrobiota bacterium]
MTIEDNIRDIIKKIGEDPERDGLLKTPERVSKALSELLIGYKEDIDKVINNAFFKVDYKEMVIVKDISFYSMCEHHMLPFFGKAHIAYIPDGVIIGLSKIPRIVNVFAKRLQVQERLTVDISKTIFEKLKPKGVGVIIEAQHLCMTSRGVKNDTAFAITSSMLGCFEKDEKIRNEFLSLIKK